MRLFSHRWIHVILSVTALSQPVFAQNVCASADEQAQMQAVKKAYLQRDIKVSASRELLQLIQKDEQCAEQSEGVCNIDFDTLFNSQDPPTSKEAKFSYQCRKNHVLVTILDNRSETQASDRQTQLDFSMVSQQKQWRIDDVRYRPVPSGAVVPFTLRKILAQPIL